MLNRRSAAAAAAAVEIAPLQDAIKILGRQPGRRARQGRHVPGDLHQMYLALKQSAERNYYTYTVRSIGYKLFTAGTICNCFGKFAMLCENVNLAYVPLM